MEFYITKLNDITYMSELTPAASLCFAKRSKAAGVNSHNNLLILRVRKLCAHLIWNIKLL